MGDETKEILPISKQIQIIDKIDLNVFDKDTYNLMRPSSSSPFRLLSMKVTFGRNAPVSFNFGIEPDREDPSYQYYSLLIGSNGVGKSILLHEVIEFFVDADCGVGTRDKNYVNIMNIVYEMDDVRYTIARNHEGFLYYRDNEKVERSAVFFPLIIATTMGMFDKFPLKKRGGKIDEKDRYNVPFYKYVGPKVNSNMYMSKTNLMLQLLSSLNTIRHKRQLTQIAKVLEFIGYDTKFTIAVR